MTISFNWANYSNLTTSNVSVSSVNVGATNAQTTNGSIASGDLLLATLGCSYSTTDPGTIVAPSGWNSIYQNVNAGAQQRIAVFWKTAGALKAAVIPSLGQIPPTEACRGS